MPGLNHERMTSVDTAWLRMDSPGNSMMIVGVSATATPLPPADFRRMIAQRFLCFTRFRHRPVADALGASWVEDLDFDLDAHLKLVVLPEPAGKAELEALAAELASTPLDPRRPMWQFHLVERYKGVVGARQGVVHRLEDWGRRQLAFPLEKIHKAHYVMMNIECDKEALAELEHAFRFNDAVLRHLTVAMREAVVAPSPMMKEEKAKSLSDRGDRGERGERSERRESAPVPAADAPAAAS